MRHSFWASLAVFFLVIFLSVLITAWQIKIIVNPDFVVRALSDSNVYSTLPQLADQIEPKGNLDLNSVAFIKVLAKSVDPTDIQEQTENFIYATASYLSDNQPTTTLIDFTKLKQSFTSKWSSIAPDIYAAGYEKLPPCADLKFDYNAISCQSTAFTKDQLKTLVQQSNPDAVIANIPNQIKMFDFFSRNQTIFSKIRQWLSWVNLAILVSSFGIGMMIFVLIALGWGDGRATLRWIGWPIAITAGPIFIALLFSGNTLNLLKTVLLPNFNSLTGQFVTPIMTALNHNIITSTMAVSALFLIVGIILLIASFLFANREATIVPPGFK